VCKRSHDFGDAKIYVGGAFKEKKGGGGGAGRTEKRNGGHYPEREPERKKEPAISR